MIPLGRARARSAIPTNAELVHDLRQIDQLLGALQRDMNADDFDDLAWLLGRRRDIKLALAWRRGQEPSKIVSLAAWRRVGVAPAEPPLQVA